MSRIGKLPVKIPAKVEVKIIGQTITVKGPKGELVQTFQPLVKVAQEGDQIIVSIEHPENRQEKSLWGLTRTLINNMIIGVTEGFSKQLEINGVGYKAGLDGQKLTLQVGFSHLVEFALPPGIQATVKGNVITISGVDKQLVGEIAAQIRAIKKPEPYKGKGIRYVDEVVRHKAGKAAKAVGAE